MPPRYAYWTILIDNAPTAFRAREQSELLPTLQQLRRTNKNVVMKWFAKGRVWESQEEARPARERARRRVEDRGKGWRPGGEHKDPRARFTKAGRKAHYEERVVARGPAANGRPWDKTSRPPDSRGPHSSDVPSDNAFHAVRSAGGQAEAGSTGQTVAEQAGPSLARQARDFPQAAGPATRRPWQSADRPRRAPGADRPAKPWQNKSDRPWRDKPSSSPRPPGQGQSDRPWQSTDSAGRAERRSTRQSRGRTSRTAHRRDKPNHSARPPRDRRSTVATGRPAVGATGHRPPGQAVAEQAGPAMARQAELFATPPRAERPALAIDRPARRTESRSAGKAVAEQVGPALARQAETFPHPGTERSPLAINRLAKRARPERPAKPWQNKSDRPWRDKPSSPPLPQGQGDRPWQSTPTREPHHRDRIAPRNRGRTRGNKRVRKTGEWRNKPPRGSEDRPGRPWQNGPSRPEGGGPDPKVTASRRKTHAPWQDQRRNLREVSRGRVVSNQIAAPGKRRQGLRAATRAVNGPNHEGGQKRRPERDVLAHSRCQDRPLPAIGRLSRNQSRLITDSRRS